MFMATALLMHVHYAFDSGSSFKFQHTVSQDLQSFYWAMYASVGNTRHRA